MAKPDLGKRHRCFHCGCAFYDLGKSKAICPRCKTDQAGAPKYEIPPELKAPRVKEKVVIPLPDEEDPIPTEFDEFAEIIVEEEEVEFDDEDDE